MERKKQTREPPGQGPISTTRQWFAAHPRAADVLLVCALLLCAFLLRLSEGIPAGPRTATVMLTLLLVQAVALAWRRTHPWPVMAVVGITYVAYELADPIVGYNDGVFVAFAGYAVARYAPAPKSFAVVGVAAAAVLLPDLLRAGLGRPLPEELALGPVEIALVVGMSWGLWLLGSSQRQVHLDAARLRNLAAQLRAEQEISARRAVTAERARIARDLHDLVAHHVSAIAMQARATAEVLSETPPPTSDLPAEDPPRRELFPRDVLGWGPTDRELVSRGVDGIGAAADIALVEMRRLLGLLSDARDTSGLRPEPSLMHLDQLATAARSAGCRVEVAVDGTVDAPAAVQVSAYRVVQEALTNVLKHAGVTDVRIDVRQAGETLTVVIANGSPSPVRVPLPGSGLGLIGMRERTALFGGTLLAGPLEAGGWQVTATFPWSGQA